MRGSLNLILIFLVVCSFCTVKAQSKTSVAPNPKTVAILPTLAYIDKKLLRPGMDSLTLIQIQKNEAFTCQLKNYHTILQRSSSYNIKFQPVLQTNNLLAEAGYTFPMLAEADKKELARILGVDMVFYGVNYRKANIKGAEERLAISAVSLVILPFYAVNMVNELPTTAIHYMLFDSHTNQTVWQHQSEDKLLSNSYLYRFQDWILKTYPVRGYIPD